jgi:hypothetical protein
MLNVILSPPQADEGTGLRIENLLSLQNITFFAQMLRFTLLRSA